MNNTNNKSLIKVFKVVTLVIYIYVLLVFFVIEPVGISKLHKRCTYETTGTIVDVEVYKHEEEDSVSYTYGPVFKFEMDGSEYVLTGSRSVKHRPEIGDVYTLFVNPEKPGEFYNPRQDTDALISSIATGIFVLIAGAVVFVIKKNLDRAKYEAIPDPSIPNPNSYYYTGPDNSDKHRIDL